MSDTVISRDRDESVALGTEIKTAVDMFRAGKHVEAKAILQDLLRIEPYFLNWTFTIMLAYPELSAIVISQREHPDQEEHLYRQLLEAAQEINGVDDPNNLHVMGVLALSLYRQDKLSEALKLRFSASDICRNHFGFDSPEFLWAQNRFAVVLFRQGKFAEAEGIIRYVLHRAITETEDDELVSIVMMNVATVLQKLGKLQDAERFHKGAIKRTLPNEIKIFGLSNLACLYEDRRHLNRAEAIFLEILALPDTSFVVEGMKKWIKQRLEKVQLRIGLSFVDETTGNIFGKPNPRWNASLEQQGLAESEMPRLTLDSILNHV